MNDPVERHRVEAEELLRAMEQQPGPRIYLAEGEAGIVREVSRLLDAASRTAITRVTNRLERGVSLRLAVESWLAHQKALVQAAR